jgi:hypothetical protein
VERGTSVELKGNFDIGNCSGVRERPFTGGYGEEWHGGSNADLELAGQSRPSG